MAGSNVYDQIINGTFDSLNPGVAEMYAGIYPTASTSSLPSSLPPPGWGASVPQWAPNLDRLTPNSNPNIPGSGVPAASFYSQPGAYVPKVGALGAIDQFAGASQPEWGSFEQAYSNASNKPGTWMAQSRMQAQALMRQMAIQRASGGYRGGGAVPGGVPAGAPVTGATAAVKPQGWQGLLSMIFGPSKNGLTGVPGLLGGQNAGGLLSILPQAQPQTPRTLSYSVPGLTPSQSYSAANQNAIAAASAHIGGTGGSTSQSSSGSSSSNLGGVSSSGRRYDYDNNQWV